MVLAYARRGGVEAARSPSVASVGVQVTRPSPRRPCVGVWGSLWQKSVGKRKSSVLLHWHRNPESPGALTKFDTPLLILVLVLVVVVLLFFLLLLLLLLVLLLLVVVVLLPSSSYLSSPSF